MEDSTTEISKKLQTSEAECKTIDEALEQLEKKPAKLATENIATLSTLTKQLVAVQALVVFAQEHTQLVKHSSTKPSHVRHAGLVINSSKINHLIFQPLTMQHA